MLFSRAKRYKIRAGSSLGGFLPLKGSGGTGLGISWVAQVTGGTSHWWHCHHGAENRPAAAKRLQHVCLLGPGGKHMHAQIPGISPASLHRGFLRLPGPLEQAAPLPGAGAAQPLRPDLSLHFGPPSPKGRLPPSRWLCGPPAAFLASDVPAAPQPCISSHASFP